MSGPAEQWAWQLQDERLSLSEKFVLVYLARRAYYDDGCARVARSWPRAIPAATSPSPGGIVPRCGTW